MLELVMRISGLRVVFEVRTDYPLDKVEEAARAAREIVLEAVSRWEAEYGGTAVVRDGLKDGGS